LLSPGQVFPIDAQGKFTAISARLTVVISVNSWIGLGVRNHNNLAGQLASLNTAWNDEKVYQEAKRLNIAIIQKIMISPKLVENVFGKFTKENYDEEIDPSTSVEFMQAVVRFNHFFVPSNMRLIDANGTVTEIPQSDLIGRVDILDKFYDESMRGALNQSIHVDQYTDEVSSKHILIEGA
jgi:Animal haem peroxidase